MAPLDTGAGAVVSRPLVALDDVCERGLEGVDPRRSSDVHFRYIDISSVDSSRKIVTEARMLLGSEAPSRARRLVRAGDVIVSMTRPNLNAVALIGPGLSGSVCSTGFCVLRPKPILTPSYLFHFVRTQSFAEHLAALTAGALYPAVTERQVRTQVLPLPSLAEQRRIVDLLDRAAGIVRLRQAALAKAREVVPALFVSMFGDLQRNPFGFPVRPLEEVAQISSGVTKGRKLNGEPTYEMPYLRVANVQDGRLDLSEVKTIPATASDRVRYALQKGDLLLTEGGDPDKLGRGAVWAGEVPGCLHQNHVFRVRADQRVVLPVFLAQVTSSPYGKSYFLSVAKRTTGIASINRTQLGALPIPLPPLDCQNAFAARIAGVHSIIVRQEHALALAGAAERALERQLLG